MQRTANACKKKIVFEMIPHGPIVRGRPESTKGEAEEEKDEEDEAWVKRGG